MSNKQKSRVYLTIEVKQFIIELRERNKTIAEIGDAVYKEFQIKTSKSAIHRTFAEKNGILATVKNGKLDLKQQKRFVYILLFFSYEPQPLC